MIIVGFCVAPCVSTGQTAPAAANDQVRMDIFDWARAWESKDIDRYMAHYHPAFRSNGQDYNQWRQRKKDLFKQTGPIRVTISQVWVAMDQNAAVAKFLQKYKDSRASDVGEKTLELEKWDGQWKIISETWAPIAGAKPEPAAPEPSATTSEIRPPPPGKPALPASPTRPAATGVSITDIQFRLSPEEETIIIEMTPYTVPSVFSLEGASPRVVIDIPGVQNWIGKSASTIDGRFIRRIRAHLHQKLGKLRIVLDLHPAENYKISRVAHPEASRYLLAISAVE